MKHYTEDQLSDYLLRPEAFADRDAMKVHLGECPECRDSLGRAERFDAALRDPIPWELAGLMSVRRPAPPELLELARTVAEDDERARELVLPVTQSASAFAAAGVTADHRYHTPAVVRLLCTIANQTHEQQPSYGLLLADTALGICSLLPQATRPAPLTGTALKERANALRYLGRFREAESALDASERAFLSDERPEPFDLAIVAYVRATVYCQMERFDDAIAAARSAAGTFYEYGDARRYLAARMAEGTGFLCAGRDVESAQVMESIAGSARDAGETGILARALLNAANSYTRLGQFDRAAERYRAARQAMDECDLPTECARISWAMAALKLETGAFQEGLAELDASRRQLLQLGMSNDAALATLDLVAGLLAVGDTARVPGLCRAISLTFTSEGMMRSARKALAFLSEAVSSGDATVETVRYVRTFLDRLSTNPREEFEQRS